MSEQNFYESLNSFRNFEDVTLDRYYEAVPSEWHLFITDIRNSTEAIENGSYRDVNKIGAATITVVREALDGLEFPFVFGGDGATIVIPPQHKQTTSRHLLALKNLARKNFDLKLRVGSMEVAEIQQPDVSLEVAKLEITSGRSITIFRGGGLTLADNLIKREYSNYKVEGQAVDNLELTGLSCRWEPIPSKRGHVLSILIQARKTPPDKIYDRVINTLNSILDDQLGQSNPINTSDMSYKTLSAILKDEIRYHESKVSISFLKRVFEILLAVIIFRLGMDPLFFDPKEYSRQLRTHSDYRKFDDMLRLIIDCNDKERKEIEEFLQSSYQSEELFYGVQESDETLMTCYLENLEQSGHLHFVDGGNGGYARAAKQLKKQVRNAAESPTP
ncbi:MAG: DUF3095 domain-containing protein [bacterium]